MPQVMTIPSTPLVFFLSLIIPHLLTLPSLIFAGDPLFRSCSAGENYTSPSLYATNLQILLANLISKTPKTKTLFFQDSVPAANNQTVFGLAQCRPDTTVAGCTDCLTGAATSATKGSCLKKKSASVRSEYCVLRYEDREFSSVAEDLGFVGLYGLDMAANPVQYRRQVRELLEGLCVEAKNGAMKIAAGVKRSDMNRGDVYGLAWCTMDLSPEACYRCLDKGLKSYDASNLDYYIGGGSITASCIVTYNDHAFLNISLIQELSRSPTHNGTDSTVGQRRGRQTQKIITAATITASISSAAIVLAIFLIRRRRLAIQKASELDVEDDIRTVESHLVPIVRLKAATNDFSNENKLGEGRFGPVYKGLLWDGRQVAVKRLSKTYGQGLVELRNEAALVAQLQHKNLVKLLGCCMEEDEKLLVYEYLPNASLDKHLYDPVGRAQLDWRRRHSIIEGIARGLVYMHDHSRVRIIHRNLNANNILLDGDMNPKISDFGLAKLVGAGESQWNTKQFAGKSGYMAPEYASRGEFSAKSDVFSYGMVVLEIITGRRNGSFVEVGNSLNLQTYVWQHWNEGISEQVIDKGLAGQYQVEDVLRCVNIGLLCIQADPEERPSMASVVLMLSTSSEMLPTPAMPAYYTGENLSSKSSASSGQTNCDDFHVMDQLIGSSREQDSMQAR